MMPIELYHSGEINVFSGEKSAETLCSVAGQCVIGEGCQGRLSLLETRIPSSLIGSVGMRNYERPAAKDKKEILEKESIKNTEDPKHCHIIGS